MTIQDAYSQIIDNKIIMPAEALAVLPQGVRLYMMVDTERGRVTIYAKDPSILPNTALLAELAELSNDQDWETYYRPVPEQLLRRPRAEED